MLVNPVKAGVADSPRWVTSQLLQALAKLAPKAGHKVDTHALDDALPDVALDRRRRGTGKLVKLGWLRSARTIGNNGLPLYVYTVTADGAAAVQAAAQGRLLMCGNRSQRLAQPGTLRARLWALVRIRKVLDADEAAQLLCDAGSNFYSTRAQCGDLLRNWAAAGVVSISTKVGKQGRKRYVLLVDQGPVAPAAPRPRPGQQGGRHV